MSNHVLQHAKGGPSVVYLMLFFCVRNLEETMDSQTYKHKLGRLVWAFLSLKKE